MAEGKPCVKRVVGRGFSKFEAFNLPKRTPGAVHRHVGGTLSPIGFICNTCAHTFRKYTRIPCYTDYFKQPPSGLDFKIHMFCPECSSEIVYESASKSIISGATVYIPPGCSDHEKVPGFTAMPFESDLIETE